jgi:hypothetical protein
VSFGYDLVGDGFNGSNRPSPDPDPMDCGGHGTHVAGIIAAQTNNPFGIQGAAPGVQLGGFRVFGCNGDVGDDILISAFNRAYEAGADIITASIGGSSGWTEEAWSVAASRIVEAGVPCTLSAGNDGSNGVFYSSTASGGKGVTAVASIDNTKAPVLFSNATYVTNNETRTNTSFGYTSGQPNQWAGVTLPLWAPNYNITDEANGCEPYSNSTKDLSGYIVLVRRGTCFFTVKAENAVARGAKYVLIYNNVAGTTTVDGTTVKGLRGIAMVTAQTGEDWIKKLAAGTNVTVAMTNPITAPKTLANEDNKISPGFSSTFTSWGPTFETDVKPQFGAPGGFILSTYPTRTGSYAVLSGTSMSCPLVAAIYALIMEARKTKDPREIQNVLASTAKPNLFHNGQVSFPFLAPVPQQGAGAVQAYDAAMSTTLLSVSSLSFNDTDNHVANHNFTITNTGKTSVIYTLGHQGAGTVYTFANDTTIFPARYPDEVRVVEAYGSLTFGPGNEVVIPAGERRVVSVSATPPTGVNTRLLPVYSGYITINGSDGSALSMPYMGVLGSMKSLQVLDPVNTFLSASLDRNATRVPPGSAFMLPPPGRMNETIYLNRTALPRLLVNLAMGSPLIRADVVPIKICGNRTAVDVLGVNSIGQVRTYPRQWEARDPLSPVVWDGKLDDNSYAPSGMYKIVVRALHIFGDRSKAGDYDSAELGPFRIKYMAAPANGTVIGGRRGKRQYLDCD